MVVTALSITTTAGGILLQNLKLDLIKKATDALNNVAATLGMEAEEAFEYLVRNTLKVYHVVELSGYMCLIDEIGNMKLLRFPGNDPSPSLLEKFIPKLLHKPEQQPTPEHGTFSVFLDEEIIEDVALQAKLYGFAHTDLYNRLIIIGSLLATHLQNGQAYAYGESGDALGKIEFTLAQ